MSSSVIGACSDGAYAEEGTGEQAGTVWSTKGMNWWTASDFCASFGKEMVSFEDLGCVANGSTYTCTVPVKFQGHAYVWTKDWRDSSKGWWVNTTSGEARADFIYGAERTIVLCH